MNSEALPPELLGQLSHELKTPVTAILLQLVLLERSIPAPLSDQQRELFTRLRGTAQRMLEMVERGLGQGPLRAEEAEPQLER
jgi:signal transduction histidine kinase